MVILSITFREIPPVLSKDSIWIESIQIELAFIGQISRQWRSSIICIQRKRGKLRLNIKYL